jgi:hypothetical protein
MYIRRRCKGIEQIAGSRTAPGRGKTCLQASQPRVPLKVGNANLSGRTLSDEQIKVLHSGPGVPYIRQVSNYLMHAITACCQIMPHSGRRWQSSTTQLQARSPNGESRARQRNRGVERGPEHDSDAPGLPRKLLSYRAPLRAFRGLVASSAAGTRS